MKNLSKSGSGLIIDFSFNNITNIDMRNAESIANEYFKEIPSFQKSKNPAKFIMNGKTLNCDCNNYHLLKYLKNEFSSKVYEMFKITYDKLSCEKPENFKDKNIKEISVNEIKCKLESLMENADQVCPKKCKCFYYEAEKKIVIDCANKMLKEIPMLLDISLLYNIKYPNINQIELNFTKNVITKLETAQYDWLKNVTKLDLSHNNIIKIDVSNLSPYLKVRYKMMNH